MKNWSHMFGVKQRAPGDHKAQHLYSGWSKSRVKINPTVLWESSLLQLPTKIPLRTATRAEAIATKTGNLWTESGRNVPQRLS